MTAPSQSFFVIFDTCTHPQYYRDVHEVLARPQHSIIRYEYKRYLFAEDAADEMDRLAKEHSDLPKDALLIYGEAKGFKQGADAPTEMLTWANGSFIALRHAKIVNVAVVPAATRRDDRIHIFLELQGFPNPPEQELAPVIQGLEVKSQLPFGDREAQYCWIASMPESVDEDARRAFRTEDQNGWSATVDRMIQAPTQFSQDIFWRVRAVKLANSGASSAVELSARGDNAPGDSNDWNVDLILHDARRYQIVVETHSPDAHGVNVVGGSSISLTPEGDEDGLIKIGPTPTRLVPNQTIPIGFRVESDQFLETRYPTLALDTQKPDHTSSYPPGSGCDLTVAVQKEKKRLFAAIVLLALATLCGGMAFAFRDKPLILAILIIAAFISAGGSYYAYSRKIRLGG